MTKFDATLVEDFELATEAEASEYIALLEQALGDQWDYTPKQEFAELLWRKCDWLLYGGAASGGKSDFACNHLVRLSLAHPNHHSLVVRQSVPELRRSLILRLIARQRQFDYPYRYKKREGTPIFEFENGSHIECGHCATDEDLGKYYSAEYAAIVIDEASQLTPDQILGLQSRLRITTKLADTGVRTHLGLFTNPGNRAHGWLYKTFVAPTDYGNAVVVYDISQGIEKIAQVRSYPAPIDVRGATIDDLYDTLIPWAEQLEIECDDETQIAVAFVQAKVTDNPHVPPSTVKNLRALPERQRRQLLDGDWDTFEGQFFHEFARDLHVVERADEFPIPSGWVRAIGLDWGEAKPYACFDDETEVLTQDGWRHFKDVTDLRTPVATWGPGGALEFQRPTHAIERYVAEDLVVCESAREGVNFAVTTDHRMAIADPRNRLDLRFVHAGDLGGVGHALIPKRCPRGWEGADDESPFVIEPSTPWSKKLPPASRPALARVIGLIISEGSVHTGSVRIVQSKNVDAVRAALDELGWAYSERTVLRSAIEFSIFSQDFRRWCIDRGLGARSAEKRIPREMFDWGPTSRAALLDGLIIGDGSPVILDERGFKRSSLRYHTSSPGLADDVQELACLAGHNATIASSHMTSGFKPDGLTMYAVNISEVDGASVGKLPIERRFYEGWVRCVTVPNGTLVVRRGGRVMVCGNCVWCAWDEDGDAWIYRCDYGAGYQTTEQAERVTKRSVMLDDNDKVVPERFQARVADPSVFARRRGMGRSIADQWRDGGLRVTRANNERIHGWQNLRNYLWDPTHVHDDGTRGRPRLHIFASCDELLDELVNAQYAKSAPEDMDTTGADHALDALRYVLMVRPMERRKPIEKITDAMELRRAKLVKKVERKRTSRRYG